MTWMEIQSHWSSMDFAIDNSMMIDFNKNLS